jgi:hypothetical protein
MYRFQQIAQNTLIRLVGFFTRVFGFFGQFFGTVFGFLGRLFGFTQSTLFVESGEAQPRSTETASSHPTASDKSASETTFAPRYVNPNATRRSTDDMEYYRRLARQIQNSD